MNYEMQNWKQNGPLKDNGDGTSTQPIMVWTGIVGDKYGFQKTNATTSTFATKLSIADAIAACNQSAIDFVTENYPNT